MIKGSLHYKLLQNLTFGLFVLLLSNQALASTSTWKAVHPNTPLGKNWNEPSNWDNGVPGALEDTDPSQAVFGGSNTVDVSLSANIIGLSNLTFTAAAPAYTISTAGRKLVFNPNSSILNNSLGGITQTLINNTPQIGPAPAQGELWFRGLIIAGTGDPIKIQNNNGKIKFIGDNAAENAKIYNDLNSTVSSEGEFNIKIGSLSGQGNIILNNSALTVGILGVNEEIAGEISGVGGSLTKTGNAILTLSAANTYSGGTKIEQGTVSVANDKNLGNPNATLTMGTNTGLAGTLKTTAGFNTNRPITLNAGGGIFEVSGAVAGALDLRGPITANGKLTKEGPGTLLLSSAIDTDFNNVLVSAGTLTKNGSNTLTNSGALIINSNASLLNVFGAITNNGMITNNINGTLVNSRTLNNNADRTINNTGTLNNNLNGTINNNGTLKNNLNGTIDNTGRLYNGGTITNDANFINSGSPTYSGRLTNYKTLSNSGTITNSGIFDNENGGTIINTGTLTNSKTLTNSGTITNSGTMTFNPGSVLDGNGTLELAGGSLVDNTNTPLTPLSWSIQVLASSTITSPLGNTFTIASPITGTQGPLIFNGQGTTQLTGVNTGYKHGLEIRQGVLRVANGENLGAAYSPGSAPNATLTMGTNTGVNDTAGTLQTTADITTNRAIKLNQGGGRFDIETTKILTLNSNISGPGSLSKEGNGTLILTGINSYTGGTTVSAGILQGNTTSLKGNIINNAKVIFDQLDVGAYDAAMSGAGSLIKKGSATLSFFNSFDYTGVITVEEGILQGRSESLLGDIENNGTVRFFQSPDGGTYAGKMSGTGKLELMPLPLTLTGELRLTGVNSYTGGTSVAAITKLIGNSASLQGDIENDGTVVFDQAVTGTYEGDMSGDGSLIKKGPEVLTVTGDLDHQGGTTVEAGTLKTGDDNLLPAEGLLTVNSGATLDITNTDQEIETLTGEGAVILGAGELTISDNGNDSSFEGVISGDDGSLVKKGGGTLTLSGKNIYGGGTKVSAGTLVGNHTSLQGDIENNATVVFDQAMVGTCQGDMSGTGAFLKQGPGALALTGANTYTGPTSIDGGRLLINFAQQAGAGIVTIGSAGTLSGTGQIQEVVNNGGILSPGDRVFGTGFETLTLVNDYGGYGTMDFKINAAGDHSTLVSTNGGFDLSHTTLSIACAGSLTGLDISQHYTLIQGQNGAENAIQGEFQNVPARIGKFVPEMIYNDNSVELSFDLVPTTFASETSSTNDRSVASELDRLSGIAEGPLEDFIFSLEGKSASELDDVFSQLDPATPGSMVETITTSGVVNALTQGRMHSIATGGSASNPGGATFTSGSGSGLSPLAASFSPGHGTDRPTHTRASLSQEQPGYQAFFGKGKGGIWAQGFALNHKQKSHKDIAGFGADTGGFITGIDTPFLLSNLYVGAAIGYGRGDVHYKQARGKSKITSHLASVYALYDTETYYVDASLAVAMNRYHNNRNIAVIGKTASSRHRGTEWAPHLGAGVNFTISQVDVQPFVNLEHMHLHEAGYTEKNADFANLTVKSRSSSQWRGETGLNVSKTMLFSHGTWTPLIRLSYIRKQPHKKSKMRSSFEGQSQTFETETLNLKQNQVSPGLGLKFKLNNGLYVTARYDAELSKLSRVHEVGLKIGYAF